MASAVPSVLLNSGHPMPMLGFGTASSTKLSEEEKVSVILDAIDAGYRLFDTAMVYGNERAIGTAIAEAIRRGLVASREELFVTSKLWCSDAHSDLVLPALTNSLRELGLDYLDLYLIHWPARVKKEDHLVVPFKPESILSFDMKSTWAAMEECQRLGLVRSIGVSNFSSKKLSQLLLHATIPPAVNQVELSPTWQQDRLRAFCAEKGICVVAWGPLGASGSYWGTNAVMESPVLRDVAGVRGKSVAQVALRWIHEQGVSLVVKSYNGERMRGNMKIFDWELSDEDREKIKGIPQRRGYNGEAFLSPYGPYQTLEQLWDGEI